MNTYQGQPNSKDSLPNSLKAINFDDEWWRGAVIYQVYPRSFRDSNGDGIGDIPGVLEKIDYIASLGVDALWLSPFFKSPMHDYGYDIADYREVDPIFGSLADFDNLVDAAKARDIKIIIDQVLSHTSDQHAWFQESKRSHNNPKSDWYIWADPGPDGEAPNNWLSVFGGSAWQWHAERQQYFMHNFLPSQPDLNYHNEEVRAQILEEIRFWLERGVDGIRIDAANFCFHDKLLRNNPVKPPEERTGRGFSPDNPYAAQYHLYDNTQPENLEFMGDIRRLLDSYPNRTSLAEINSENSLSTIAEYTQGQSKLHMGYSFELLSDEFSAAFIRDTVETLERDIGDGWPCWAISNHDVQRVVSRWGNGSHTDEFAKCLLAMAASLRGTLCVYQGEELGFAEAQIEQHQLKDPFGIRFWPEFKGRDGCRTPIAWDANLPHGGFSQVVPWLPVADIHRGNCVVFQENDPSSVLNFYRAFLDWRHSQPILSKGSIRFIECDEPILAFIREHQERQLLLCFNLGNTEAKTNFTQSFINPRCVFPTDAPSLILQDEALAEITLDPYEFVFIEFD
ncbi:MAG: alpha-glucosidase [Pseudomonadota bacterium]